MQALQFYDQEIVNLSTLAILKHVLSSGNSARHLIAIIAQSKPQHITLIFSKIVWLWAECCLSQITEKVMGDPHLGWDRSQFVVGIVAPVVDTSFYGREKTRLWERASNSDTAVYNILHFTTRAAGFGLPMRQAMMDAGVLALVPLAYVNQRFQTEKMLECVKHPRCGSRGEAYPIPLDVINAEAATLASLVATPGFRANWSGQAYMARRAACSQFLKVLFGNAGESGQSSELEEKYWWMRALYQKIVVLS
ncbi:hypothetical protein HWV62_25561 [Athelia sp. TMB]|nr:hypothetical protein HWV62_25561 [Athelia sp. TMB]